MQTVMTWMVLDATVGGGSGAPSQLGSLQGPAGVVFAAAFFLAAWQPDGAWRRGVMLGLAVPIAHAIASLTGNTLPFRVDPPAYTVLALVPAMIGTMIGVRVSRLRHADPPSR